MVSGRTSVAAGAAVVVPRLPGVEAEAESAAAAACGGGGGERGVDEGPARDAGCFHVLCGDRGREVGGAGPEEGRARRGEAVNGCPAAAGEAARPRGDTESGGGRGSPSWGRLRSGEVSGVVGRSQLLLSMADRK